MSHGIVLFPFLGPRHLSTEGKPNKHKSCTLYSDDSRHRHTVTYRTNWFRHNPYKLHNYAHIGILGIMWSRGSLVIQKSSSYDDCRLAWYYSVDMNLDDILLSVYQPKTPVFCGTDPLGLASFLDSFDASNVSIYFPGLDPGSNKECIWTQKVWMPCLNQNRTHQHTGSMSPKQGCYGCVCTL